MEAKLLQEVAERIKAQLVRQADQSLIGSNQSGRLKQMSEFIEAGYLSGQMTVC